MIIEIMIPILIILSMIIIVYGASTSSGEGLILSIIFVALIWISFFTGYYTHQNNDLMNNSWHYCNAGAGKIEEVPGSSPTTNGTILPCIRKE